MKNFQKYHEENPKIYNEFKSLAKMLISRNYKRIGAKQIFEYIRFQTMISGNDGYKLNNSYTSDYARLFKEEYPHWAGYFQTRVCKVKN
jgi:hypothetical protein